MGPFPPTDRLIFDDDALRRLLESPDGPVVGELMRRGELVESQAKVNASGRPGPRVDTGRLRSSISHRPGVDALGPYVDVGTAVFYARHLELGWTTKRGRFVQYPFLVPALTAAAG